MSKLTMWDELYRRARPVFGLSPMDGVTDAPFRYMVAKYGRPDVIFTEFVSVDGLHYAEGRKRERMLADFLKASELQPRDLRDETERWPYEVAQVFGNKPEFFREAARIVESLGFDGIDINMGCPAKNVAENGCGAGLIRTPELAQEIVRVTKASTSLPVSVKTRVGVSSVSEMEEWIRAICEVEPANISLHGRTLKQLYQGEADWEAIGRAAEIVHESGLRILGNGDVGTITAGLLKVAQYGVDGVLIGRAAEGNPAVFRGESEVEQGQKLQWAIEHAQIYESVFKPESASEDDVRWFLPMRKHLAWYAHGFPGAVELRMRLMKTRSASEVESVIREVK